MSIESAAFPNVYLRMERGVTQYTDAGGGTVNCQFGAHAWEMFVIEPSDD